MRKGVVADETLDVNSRTKLDWRGIVVPTRRRLGGPYLLESPAILPQCVEEALAGHLIQQVLG